MHISLMNYREGVEEDLYKLSSLEINERGRECSADFEGD